MDDDELVFIQGEYKKSKKIERFDSEESRERVIEQDDRMDEQDVDDVNKMFKKENFKINNDDPWQTPVNDIPPRQIQYNNPPALRGVTMLARPLNCVHVADHLVECPVCSKLHKSNKGIYITIIMSLLLILFFIASKKLFS